MANDYEDLEKDGRVIDVMRRQEKDDEYDEDFDGELDDYDY